MASGFMVFQPAIGDSPPSSPSESALGPEDFFSASAGQLNAMHELGMSALSDQQQAAITSSRSVLQTMTSPNCLLNYPAKDFKSLLAQAAGRFNLQLLDIKFGRQEVLALASFQDGPTSLGDAGALKFVFRISPAIEKRINPQTTREEQVLVLRYSMGLARLDQTDLSDTSPEEISGAANDQVGQADTVSQDPTPLIIPLPLEIARPIDLNKSFSDPTTNSVITMSSSKVQAVLSLAASVLFIDEQGLHLIGVLEAK